MEEYKVSILGDKRTALLQAFLSRSKAWNHDPIVTDCYWTESMINKKHIILNIFDTTGREQCYTALNNPSLRKSQGFILIYSITDERTFDDLAEYRQEIFRVKDTMSFKDNNIPFVIAGNDCHMEHERRVSKKQGEDLAKDWECPFLETSHEMYHNVDEIFTQVVIQISWKNSGPYHSSVRDSNTDFADKRRRHKQAYKKAIKEKMTLNICPVHFNHIGLPRSGKTTFRRRLMGDILNILTGGEKFQPSTGIAEAGGQCFIRTMCTEMGTVQSKVWALLQNFGEEAGMIQQFIYQTVLNNQTITGSSAAKRTPPTASHKPYVGASSFVPKRLMWKNFLSLFSSGSDSPSKKDLRETFSVIREVMSDDEWDKTKFLLEDLILLINTDTGGQEEFLDLQASLVQGPSLNLLYRRLVDDLDSQFKTYYTNEEGRSTDKEDSTTTVQEVLFQALSGIACFGESFTDDDILPSKEEGSTRDKLSGHSKAIFVGTHRDLITEEEFRRKDQLLRQRIMNTEFYDKNIIEFASDDQLMIAVDNMNGGLGEIIKIRNVLEQAIERNFKKIPIPVSWFMLNLCIRKTGVRTMSLDDCEELAWKLRINPDELQEVLWFMHHYIGVLLYYPEIESLKRTLICDIQVVFDSASNLIKNTFTFGKVGHKRSHEFKEKAQFSLKDLKKATSGNTDDLLPLEKLVDLLKYRNVITTIPPASSEAKESNFFMPSLLISARADELIVPHFSDSDPPSLMLRYDCGYIPIGVFPAVVTNLVSQQRKDWEMITGGLRKNRVQFFVGEDYDTITLISHVRFLEIAVSRRQNFNTPTESVCANVRSIIQSTLESVTSHLNYRFRMQYKFGFECPTHPGLPREHICVLAKETASLMECLQDPKKKQLVPLEPHHRVWFVGKKTSSVVAHSKNGGGTSARRPSVVCGESPVNITRPVLSQSKFLSEHSQLQSTELECTSHIQHFSPHGQHLPHCVDLSLTLRDQPRLYQLRSLKIDGERLKIIQKVGIDWTKVALSLKFDYSVIRTIEYDYPHMTEKACEEMLQRWLNGEACKPITWQRLIQALDEAEHGTLAKKVRDLIS